MVAEDPPSMGRTTQPGSSGQPNNPRMMVSLRRSMRCPSLLPVPSTVSGMVTARDPVVTGPSPPAGYLVGIPFIDQEATCVSFLPCA